MFIYFPLSILAIILLSIVPISFGTDYTDVDGDGIPNDIDNCPTEENPEQTDSDAQSRCD